MITRFLIKNIESVQGRIQQMKQDSPTSPPCKSAVTSDPPPQDPMISETPAKPPQTSKNLPASLQRKRGRPRKQEQVSNGEVADQDEAPDANFQKSSGKPPKKKRQTQKAGASFKRRSGRPRRGSRRKKGEEMTIKGNTFPWVVLKRSDRGLKLCDTQLNTMCANGCVSHKRK